jgi:hypothetical protein
MRFFIPSFTFKVQPFYCGYPLFFRALPTIYLCEKTNPLTEREILLANIRVPICKSTIISVISSFQIQSLPKLLRIGIKVTSILLSRLCYV